MHAVDWLTGGEENASFLTLQASVLSVRFVVKSKNLYLKNYTREQVDIYIIASIYVNLDAKRLEEKLHQKKKLREFSELCKYL